MFGRFRIVKIKIPRPCCPWCQSQTEILQERVRTLEEQIARLESSIAFRQQMVVAVTDGEIGSFLKLARMETGEPLSCRS
jgi:hypothetical protein